MVDTEEQSTVVPMELEEGDDGHADSSGLDARLLAASDLTFTSVDDSFLANLSASAATAHTDETAWQQSIAEGADTWQASQSAMDIQHPHAYALSMHCSVTAAVYDLMNEELAGQRQHHKLQYKLDTVRDRRRHLSAALARMQAQYATSDASREDMKQRIHEWQQNTDVLLQKANEYDRRAAQHRSRYEATGVPAEQLDVPHLQALEKTVEETEHMCEKVARQRDVFHDLPPDLNLARLKLMEAREQLMDSHDADIRFMALNDLQAQLQKSKDKLDDALERRLVDNVLKMVRDSNGEVQNLAVQW
ncbi:hypothetical protein SYNPS1DRAFT_31909 [Syncephalis pseudoplumigaleata]|uniref:Uncharacterized protein n=1 Tax=Syncephalis pseudoplumigaleata TaxID=1712513 RepID=A0A4V1J0R6_9FUNG|nr:hypothetical protein SYNPS1DRAFT_31909 [Syncephalis pseudoplumigaleata]|eukprot:RKP22489.1 hypothetical protein SYNPS1DRAFT_31909 [Syncephalis pseudoplumigaleata]